jgi:hypothetical protein
MMDGILVDLNLNHHLHLVLVFCFDLVQPPLPLLHLMILFCLSLLLSYFFLLFFFGGTFVGSSSKSVESSTGFVSFFSLLAFGLDFLFFGVEAFFGIEAFFGFGWFLVMGGFWVLVVLRGRLYGEEGGGEKGGEKGGKREGEEGGEKEGGEGGGFGTNVYLSHHFARVSKKDAISGASLGWCSSVIINSGTLINLILDEERDLQISCGVSFVSTTEIAKTIHLLSLNRM